MATNKHKKGGNNKAASKAATAASIAATSNAVNAAQKQAEALTSDIKPGLFTRGQFNCLILMCLAVSRIMMIASSVSYPTTKMEEENTTTTTTAEEDTNNATSSSSNIVMMMNASKTCLTYLSEEACQDASFQTLLRFKYYSALNACVIIFWSMITLWNFDSLLQSMHCLFLISPLTLLFGALNTNLGKSVLLNASQNNGILCIVLVALITPQNKMQIPFLQQRRPKSSTGTIQSLSISTLSLASLFEAMRLGHALYFFDGDWLTSLLQPANDVFVDVVDAAMDAARLAMQLQMIDYLTLSLVLAFCWYHLEDRHQRMILPVVCIVKLVEYFYQIPALSPTPPESLLQLFEEDYQLTSGVGLTSIDNRRFVALTLAAIAGVAWILPRGMSGGGRGADAKEALMAAAAAAAAAKDEKVKAS